MTVANHGSGTWRALLAFLVEFCMHGRSVDNLISAQALREYCVITDQSPYWTAFSLGIWLNRCSKLKSILGCEFRSSDINLISLWC
jgi:hypothetical protein